MRVKVADPDPAKFPALILKENVPLRVGIPAIFPVRGFRVSPIGEKPLPL